MNHRIRNLGIAALAAAGLFFSAQASADSLAYAVATDNWTFSGVNQVDVEGMTTNVFTKPDDKRLFVTFTAECAVAAPDSDSWMDIDIVLINAQTNAVVYTASPTVGSGDAFCASTGTNGFGHWQSNAVQALIPIHYAAGSYKIGVKARLNYNATGGWLGERMVTVMQ